MKRFILGGNVAYTTATDFAAVAAGAVGVFYNASGVPTVSADGAAITKECMLVLGRAASAGGPVTVPMYKHKFSYVKGTYIAATTFGATFVVPAPSQVGDHTLIVMKKGMQLHEKAKWTFTVYVNDVTMSAATLANKFLTLINAQSSNSNITATLATATLTFAADTSGIDYTILPVDNLSGNTVTIVTAGKKAYGDAAYVRELADKAAAESGFEYTFELGRNKLYPGYPLEPLASPLATDNGFTIFTIKFSEPRRIKTTEQSVNQIVQVAFPTGAAQIATFETVLAAIAANS